MKSAVFAACVAAACLACGRERSQPARVLTDPSAILARLNARYLHASTYTDQGAVDTARDLTERVFLWFFRGPSHDTFTTSFTRPRVHFLYHPQYGRTREAEGVPGDRDFELALSSVRGISCRAADFSVGLLSPDSPKRPLASMQEVKLLRYDEVHHRRCYVITGKDRVFNYRVSIDMESFLVLRILVTSPIKPDYIVTIDYWPVIS
jgi:hypothetical protein